MYEPQALNAKITPNLQLLIEQIAERVHDSWAAERLSKGWTLGPKRSDENREHPSLVPYNELPESEKDLDRVMVRTSLAAILELGYDIVRREAASV